MYDPSGGQEVSANLKRKYFPFYDNNKTSLEIMYFWFRNEIFKRPLSVSNIYTILEVWVLIQFNFYFIIV